MKTCTVCKLQKEFDEYYKSKREKDGYNYRCKICDNIARTTSRNRKVPFKENKTRVGYQRRWLFYKYGMLQNQYETMLAEQGYCCAICKTTNPRGEGVQSEKELSFSVDHDHATGEVRGLLCNLCNRALGFLQDDVMIVASALDYLIKFKKGI